MWIFASTGIFLLIQPDSAITFTFGSGFAVGVPFLGIALFVVIWRWTIRQGRFDPFEFPTWFSLNLYLQVIVNIWLLGPSFNPDGPFMSARNTAELAAKTLFLFSLGLASLWGGYGWFSSILSARPPYKGEINLANVKLGALYAAWSLTAGLVLLSAFAGVSGYLDAGQFKGLRNYLYFIMLFRDGIALLIMIDYFKKSSPSKLSWLFVIVLSTFVLNIFNGSKGAIFVFFYLIVAYYYVRGKFNKTMLIGGALVIVVTVPLVNVYRTRLLSIGSESTTNTGRISALNQSIDELRSLNFESMFTNTRDTLNYRQGSQLELTGAILLIHPEQEQFVGEEISKLILQSLIPRVLWQSKPTGNIGPYSRLRSTYLGLPENVGGLVAPGPIADSYRFGGWISTIIWMFLIGVFGAWLYHRGPRTGHPFWTMIYLIVTIQIITFENSILSILVGVTQLGLLVGIILIAFSPPNTLMSPRHGTARQAGPLN